MRSTSRSIQGPRPIAVGAGRFAAFLSRSAGLGSLIIALIVALADLEGESEDRRPSTRAV